MAVSKEKAYYKAVRRAAAIANSDTALKDALNAIVRGTARAMKAGASLMLLDSARKKLIHSASWGLPQSYIRKGVLDADKSLAEVLTGEPAIITDVNRDSRVQYPEMAAKAGIASMLGVPVMIGSEAVGSIRIYTKEHSEFSNQDVNFVTTIANLTAVALHTSELRQIRTSQQDMAATKTAILQQARAVTFAHPSEEELAHLLDFYQIEWVYEPHSFALNWEGDRVTEMFTPDFYLPGLNLYVELTTLKQSLVTEKNRKLRRLRQLYPEVNITLLYKRDFERLLAKYGCGPLAQLRGHDVSRVLYSSAEIQQRVRELAEQISRDYAELIKDLDLSVAGRHVIMVEDIVDTGMTLNYILHHLKAKGPSSLVVCTLLDKPVRRLADIHLDYVGFEVPDKFVVGYGLDYGEEYRNLPFIGVLEPEETKIKSELPSVVAQKDEPL